MLQLKPGWNTPFLVTLLLFVIVLWIQSGKQILNQLL